MRLNALEVSGEKSRWLREALSDGEEVVWSGEPAPRYFTKENLPLFLFAIPWTGFSVSWVLSSMSFIPSDAGAFGIMFPLFGLPFVVSGLFMLSAPLRTRLALTRTAYAITRRRAVIVEHDVFQKRTVRSYEASDLGPISRVEQASDRSDVFFASEVSSDSDGGRIETPIGFYGVLRAKRAEEALRDLANAHSAPLAERPT